MKRLVILVVLLLCACSREVEEQSVEVEKSKLVEEMGVWEVANPEDLGYDKEAFAALSQGLKHPLAGDWHSFLVVKDGYLIFEEYKKDKDAMIGYEDYVEKHFDMHTEDLIFSSTKSVVSILMARALRENKVDSIDDSIKLYLPEYQEYFDSGKSEITIADTMNMGTGLDFDGWAGPYSRFDDRHLWQQLRKSSDPVAMTLSLNQVEQPGNRFRYNGGSLEITSKIIENTSMLSISEFSKKYLFEPLKIDGAHFLINEGGREAVDWGLFIKPRDLAKIGYLVANDGMWNGEKLIGDDYLKEASKAKFENKYYSTDYKYFWWLPEYEVDGRKVEVLMSYGYGGNYMLIFPEYDLVVVTTAGNWDFNKEFEYVGQRDIHLYPFRLIANYVIPAVTNKRAVFISETL